MASEAESSRIVAQALQSTQQQRLAAAKQEAQDAAVDVEVLRNASAHLGTQQVLQSLLLGAQAEERKRRERVALVQVPEGGNTTLLEKRYREKREAISQVLQQRSTAARSLEVLTAALEDESGYLADLQMTCELAQVSYQRLETSQPARDSGSKSPPASEQEKLPGSTAKAEEKPARAAKAQQRPAPVTVVHHRRALRSSTGQAHQAEGHAAHAPRASAKLGAAAKASPEGHAAKAAHAPRAVAKLRKAAKAPVALTGIHKATAPASSTDQESTAAKESTAAPIDDTKQSTAASASAHDKSSEAAAASAGPQDKPIESIVASVSAQDKPTEPTAAPAAVQKNSVVASAGTHKEPKKAKVTPSVGEVYDAGMPSEYRAWTPDGSAPTPPPDKDFESSPTKHMMALLGDSDDEVLQAGAKPAAQRPGVKGKANAKTVHAAATSEAASHGSADKPQPVPVAKPPPAAPAKEVELAAPERKTATADALEDAAADASADGSADGSPAAADPKVEPMAVEHQAEPTDSSATADAKAGTVPQKEPLDSTAATHEEAAARPQPRGAKPTPASTDHAHDAQAKAPSQVSFASDDEIDQAFPTPAKHHVLSALEAKHEGNLPTQYDAWDPSEEKPSVRGETSLEQMVADFRNDDEEDQEQAKPLAKKVRRSRPAKVEAEPSVVYDDDDLPKHHRRPVFTDLQGGWKSFIAKGAASKPHKSKLDPDIAIMNSLYSNDGGLPQQYTAWTPPAPSFLQQPANASVAAGAVLEQYGAALRSETLRKLGRSRPAQTKLAALWQRLQPLTQRQSQAQRWCLYFQKHAQAAEPVRLAVSRAEAAGNTLAAASAQRAAMAEEMNARTQLSRTVEQDVHSLTELLNATLDVTEVADALRATLKRRGAVLAAQQQQLAELRKAMRGEEGKLGEKKAAQAQAQKGLVAARKKVAGIQLGCNAALRSLQQQEHPGHMEAHAIEVALQVYAGEA